MPVVVDGRFQLEQSLGRGAFGEAHLARDLHTGGQVVVKLLHAELADEHLHLERFKREVAALQQLRHPHVVELRACGVCATLDQPYYVTTFSPGRPLDAIMQEEKPLPLRRACRLMAQLLQGLAAAHALGIVHRDLKPANILVERAGNADEQVRLLDFGLVKDLRAESREDLTQHQPLGTPLYMPPEQCGGDGVSPKSDVYAAGALLMELLTGKPPFVAETTLGILNSHAIEPPPRLDQRLFDAPPALCDVVGRALAKAPLARPSAEGFRDVLLEVLEAPRRPTPAPTPPPSADPPTNLRPGGQVDGFRLREELERGAALVAFRTLLAGRPAVLWTLLPEAPDPRAAARRLTAILRERQRARGVAPRAGRGAWNVPYVVYAEDPGQGSPAEAGETQELTATSADLPWLRPETLRVSPETRCLALLTGPWAGRVHPLPAVGRAVRLGLAPQAELPISNDDSRVAPEHSWMEQREDGLWVGDAEALGGTSVDQVPAGRAGLRLPDGAILRMGGVLLVAGPLGELRNPRPVDLVLRRLDDDAVRVQLDTPRYLGSGPGAVPGPEAAGDPRVASLHCRLTPRCGHLILEDLASPSGTFHEGGPVNEAVLRAGDELSLGGGPRFRVESASAELPALEDSSLTPLPESHPTVRAKLEVAFEGQVGRLFLFGGTRLRFGRRRQGGRGEGNDLMLRPFPRRGENYAQLAERTRRLSGRHGSLLVTRDSVAVEDVGSTHGTTLNGASLRPRVPVALPASFLLDVAGVALRGTVFRGLGRGDGQRVGLEGSHPVEAVRLERTRDGGHHSYVLLVREATIGSGEDDALFLPQARVRAGHARLVFVKGRFGIQALRADAPVLISGRGLLAPGALVALEPGVRIRLGGAILRFSEADDDDMKPD